MMLPSFRLLRFYLGRLGRVGLAGAVLIAGSLVYDAAVVRPREATLEALLLRNVAARRLAEAQRARAANEADASLAQRPTLAPAAAVRGRKMGSHIPGSKNAATT